MAFARNHDKAAEMQHQYWERGVDAIQSYLLAETYKIEDKIISFLKKTDTPKRASEFEKQVADHRAKNMEESLKMDYSNSNSVCLAFLSCIESYTSMACTYAGMDDNPKGRERRASEISRAFEQLIETIDYGSFVDLNKTVRILAEHGTMDTATVKDWIAERQNDGFGTRADCNPLQKAFMNMKYLSPHDEFWVEKTKGLKDAMGSVLFNGVSRQLLCLSAYSNANAAPYGDDMACEALCGDAMHDLKLLIGVHAEKAVRSMLRNAQGKPIQKEPMDNGGKIFVQRMSNGIDSFRKFMADEIHKKENSLGFELAKRGMTKSNMKAFDEISKANDIQRREQKMADVTRMALSNPRDPAMLDAALKEFVTFNTMYYLTILVPSTLSGSMFITIASPSLSASTLRSEDGPRDRLLHGIDEIKSLVLDMTVSNIKAAIELLDGKVEKGELSELSEWFVKRSAEDFKFEKRQPAIDGMMTVMHVEDWMGIASNEIAKGISNYFLALKAFSNAAAGLDGAALKNLAELKELDRVDANSYAEYDHIMRVSAQN